MTARDSLTAALILACAAFTFFVLFGLPLMIWGPLPNTPYSVLDECTRLNLAPITHYDSHGTIASIECNPKPKARR